MAIYLTTQVLGNIFNKMPMITNNEMPIIIQAPSFYALSWLIAESGKLKDEGLSTLCLEATVEEINLNKKDEIKNLDTLVKSLNVRTPRQIKEEMELLADEFIYEAKVLFRIKRDIYRAIVLN